LLCDFTVAARPFIQRSILINALRQNRAETIGQSAPMSGSKDKRGEVQLTLGRSALRKAASESAAKSQNNVETMYQQNGAPQRLRRE
jgi:hypothetical protein